MCRVVRRQRNSASRNLMINGEDSVDEPHTLIFDLDGTLIDSSGDVCRALNELLKNEFHYRGPALSEALVKPMIGDGMNALVERAIKEASLDLPVEKQEVKALVLALATIYDKQDYSHTRCLPMVMETLTTLKEDGGHNMVVCTNKHTQPTVDILNHFGLRSFFSAVVGGNALPVQKPNPGHLIAAVEMGGGDVNRALMIGDGHNDVLVARNAGVPVIALSWEYGYSKIPLEQLQPNTIVDSFEDIPQAIEHLVDVSMY